MRRYLALLLLSVPAWCQFAEIATTDDGRQVYFTTTLAERSSPATARTEMRIFKVEGRSAQLFAERPIGVGGGSGAAALHVTGDGQSVAFLLGNTCLPSEPCSPADRAEIRGHQAQVLGNASNLLLSRNGQWALLIPPIQFGNGNQPPLWPTESVLMNLVTGERTTVGLPATRSSRFALASDGSVFQRSQSATGAGQIGIWKNGNFSQLQPGRSGLYSFLGLSDDANIVLASRSDLPVPGQLSIPQLIAIDIGAGTSKVGHSPAESLIYSLLGMDNAGRRALLRTSNPLGSGPALLVDLESARTITIPLPSGEAVIAGTLSGNGKVAIVGQREDVYSASLSMAMELSLLRMTSFQRLPIWTFDCQLRPDRCLVWCLQWWAISIGPGD